MKKYITSFILLFISLFGISQESISRREGFKIIERQSNNFPKFYRAFKDIEKNETLFSKYEFVRGNGTGTAGKANGKNGVIIIDISYIEQERKKHDDNRMAIVLYHELGHLYYYSEFPKKQNDAAENEKYAFKYSLKRVRKLAEEEGDCAILKSAVESMLDRSSRKNMNDPHNVALKEFINERLFIKCVEIVKNCENK